ncbi:MAG TPA: divalent-cation tolerance protein CutA [Acidobacteria bacterium]|nr:divalent-cation tolerance protein CutA [Acidobacteriota bacterium]
MQAFLVMTTAGSAEEASRIAGELVGRRQAACVNLVPGIRSVYRWQGKVCEEQEVLLLVKTLREDLEGVQATIRELHSYELPEILCFQADHGEPAFLRWIAAGVDKTSPE